MTIGGAAALQVDGGEHRPQREGSRAQCHRRVHPDERADEADREPTADLQPARSHRIDADSRPPRHRVGTQ
ncbi:MAG: hypothetical protein ACRYF3_16435, partial [Janthinobacterium lividum]